MNPDGTNAIDTIGEQVQQYANDLETLSENVEVLKENVLVVPEEEE